MRAPRYHIRHVLGIWAVLSVVFVALAILIVPLVEREPASSVAGFASLTDLVFTAVAVPVSLFVWVFVFYSVFAFREKTPASGRVEDLEDGPPLQATSRQQIAWLAVTSALAFFTVGWGMFGFYEETTKSAANALVVNVTGQEWTWTYAYPKLGVQSHLLELRSAGRCSSESHPTTCCTASASLRSGSRWTPTPVSGWPHRSSRPTKPGTFEVRCVELCGLYHTFSGRRSRSSLHRPCGLRSRRTGVTRVS